MWLKTFNEKYGEKGYALVKGPDPREGKYTLYKDMKAVNKFDTIDEAVDEVEWEIYRKETDHF